jgi:hypothetical protein
MADRSRVALEQIIGHLARFKAEDVTPFAPASRGRRTVRGRASG